MLLPEDLLSEVLLRLPPESLIRFKCVSKAWEAIINGPNFMREYLRVKYNGSSTHRCSLLICKTQAYAGDSVISLSLDDDDYDDVSIDLKGAPGVSHVYDETVEVFSLWTSVSGPIDGIYCIMFQGPTPYPITLWNPAYGRFHVLPPIPPPAMLGPLVEGQRGGDVMWHEDIRRLDDFFGGFVFDPLSKDYKVLCISEYGDKYCSYHLVGFHKYSLASNSWEELHHSQIAYPPDAFTFHDDGRSCNNTWTSFVRGKLAFSFNGWCHLIYFCIDSRGFSVEMLTFDMANDVFSLTTIPKTAISEVDAVEFDGKLMTIDGCLAVAFPRREGRASVHDSDISIRNIPAIGVAVMKEYGVEESWVMAYNIELNSPGKMVGFFDNRVFVQEQTEDECVVSYRLGAQQKEYEKHCCVPFNDYVILPFQGSLIPPFPKPNTN